MSDWSDHYEAQIREMENANREVRQQASIVRAGGRQAHAARLDARAARYRTAADHLRSHYEDRCDCGASGEEIIAAARAD